MKKILCLFMAVCMVFSLCVQTAFAATSDFAVISIPVTKIVESTGNVAPGEEVFSFEIAETFAENNCRVIENTITTNGSGSYDGNFVVVVPTESDFWNLSEGMVIAEKNDSKDNWTYDQNKWFVRIDRDARGSVTFECFSIGANDDISDVYDETSNAVTKMTFTNTYNKNRDNGDDKQEYKIEFPVTKTVTLGGKNNSPKETFSFEISDQEEKPFDVSIKIETNGKGVYKQNVSVITDSAYVYRRLMGGFYISEVDDNKADWTYDQSKWFVVPEETNDGYSFAVYDQMPYVQTTRIEPVERDNISFLNIYTNNDDNTNTKTNEYTIKIPLTKIVKKETSVDPFKKTFSFNIKDYDANKKDISIYNTSVETDGAGTYESTLMITPADEAALKALLSGFVVYEESAEESGWTFDDTYWTVYPEIGSDGKISVACFSSKEEDPDKYEKGVSFTNIFSTAKKDKDEKVILTYDPNGGTVFGDKEEYIKGTTAELVKVPSRDGFTFTGWYLDSSLSTGVNSLVMNEDKTVYAGWKQTPVPELLNGDDHNYYVLGYEDGTVRPDNNITRAEVTMIFYRLLKEEVRNANHSTENVFTDVPAGEWYNEAVSTMAKIGVIKGRTENSFEPDASITRAEYSAICARFDKSVSSGKSTFTDIKGHWAENEINRAVILGWVKGYEDNTFRPENNITRAEAMTLTNRVLQRLPESKDDLLPGMIVFPDCTEADWFYLPVQEASNSHHYDRKENGYEKWTALK